jgi:hypothetical protein
MDEMGQTVIDRDVPCRDCGYNLRSLSMGGRCPECGGEVGRSLENWLANIDPHKSRLLTKGLMLVILTAVLRVPVVAVWIAVCAHVRLLPPRMMYFLISRPEVPLVLLWLDCTAFVSLSPLRHWHVRWSLPLMAAVSVCESYWIYGTYRWDSFAVAVAIVENVFFAGIAFFWCRDARRLAISAGESALVSDFAVLGAVMPLATLIFILGIQCDLSGIGSLNISRGLNSVNIRYSPWRVDNLLMIGGSVLIIPAMLVMVRLLLVLRFRIRQTMLVGG